MKSIAIYNNKGGVGKSTLALFIADFFSSITLPALGRRARTLLIDLDAQASSSEALLGVERVGACRQQGRTVHHFLWEAANAKRPDLADYLVERPKGETRGKQIPLGEMSVLLPDRERLIRLEKHCSLACARKLSKRLRKATEGHFDVVLIDLPANIDERNTASLTGLLASDEILIPTEPTRITQNALVDTFNMIHYVRGAAGGAKQKSPVIAGILLNKTDRRTTQYRRHNVELRELATKHEAPVFDAFLPAAPTLATASDDSITFAGLREKYDSYYPNVRKVVLELAKRAVERG